MRAGTRKRDAERIAVEIQARLHAGLVGGAVVTKRATFGEFAEKWLAMRTARPTTLRRDRGLINTYLNPSFGSTLLSRITVDDILTLLSRVTRERSPGTSRRLLAVLGKILGDAAKRDYIFQNPIAKLDRWDKPRARRKPPQALTLDELMRLLKSLPSRWAALSLFATLTGLRWSEIASLEWSDFDFGQKKIRVRRATPVGTNIPSELKSFTSHRSVNMLWPIQFAFINAPRRGHLVFPGLRGGLINHGWFNRRIWLATTRGVGIHYRFHDLRHTFASLLLAWGEPILYVSQQLGHSRADFTLTTYAHLIQEDHRLNKEETLQNLFRAAHRDRDALQLTLPWGRTLK
jgi:integrase